MEIVWKFISGFSAMLSGATASFIILDRLRKTTPTAVIVMRPLSETGSVLLPHLSIGNPADRPIIVRWENKSCQMRFAMAPDRSIRSNLHSLLREEAVVVIDAGKKKELPLYYPEGLEKIDPDDCIGLDIYWRFAQPILCKRYRRIPVKISKRSMMHLDCDGYDSGYM